MANTLPPIPQHHPESAIVSHPRGEFSLIQEWYGDLVELAGLGIWVFNADGKTTYVNRPLADALGYAVDEMTSLPISELCDIATQMPEIGLSARPRTAGHHVHEVKMVHKTGREIWFLITTSSIVDRDGEFRGAVSMLMNITDRKRIESERREIEDVLRNSETRYRTVFDNTLDGLVIFDDEMRYLDANPAALRDFDLTREELLSHKVTDFVRPENRSGFTNFVGRIHAEGKAVGVFHRTINGREKTFEYKASANFLPGQHIAVMRDITERVRNEKLIAGQVEVLEMIATGRRLREILNRIACLVEDVDPQLRAAVLLVSEDGRRLSMTAAPNLPGPFIEAAQKIPVECGMGTCATAILEGAETVAEDISTSPYWEKIKEVPLAFGFTGSVSTAIQSASRNVLGTICFLFQESVTPTSWHRNLMATATNLASIAITRTQYEEKLRESEARFRAMIEKNADGIALLDREGRITYCSPAITQILGYDAKDLVGKVDPSRIHPEDRVRVMEELQTLLCNPGMSASIECRVRSKEREWLWLDMAGTNLLHDPDMQAIVINLRDKTARKNVEAALRASEERFSKAFQASPIPASISTLEEGRFVDVNDVWLRTMGYTREEVIGKTSQEINFVIPSVPRQELIDRVKREGGVKGWEFGIRLRNGDKRTFLGAVEIIELDGAEYFLVVSQDITLRKEMEDKIRVSEERFSKAFNSSPLPLSISTFDEGRYINVNQAWLDAMGYSREEIIGKTAVEVNLQAVKVQREHVIERLKREGQLRDWEVCYRLKSGEIRTFQLSIEIIQLEDKDFLLTTSKDITERKRNEDRLRRSEMRYRLLFERNLGGVYRTSLDGSLLEGNLSFARILSFGSFDELRGKNFWEYYANEDEPAKIIEALRKFGRVSNYEVELRRSDGTRIWTLSNITFVPSEEGEAEILEGVVLDITELKLAQEAVRESRERYKALFDHSFVGIYRTTLDGKVLECNEALANMFRYESPEEIREISAWDLYFDPRDREEVFSDAVRSNRFTNVERRMRRKDGTPIWTLSNGTLFESGNNREQILEGVILDITDRKKSEDELRDHRGQLRALSARVESVREEERKSIAREIHDQLGQLMTGLKLEFAWVEKRINQTEDQLLREKLIPKMNEIDELLDTTIQTVRDIASKLRPGHLDDLGLIAAIQWEAKNTCNRIGVKPEFNLCREPANLASDVSIGLFRIFQEIMTNVARHAQATKVQINLSDNDEMIVLIVKDDGVGITPEKLNNPKSLGLIGMKERALLLEGEVQVEPGRRRGTKVTVRIPRK